MDPTSFLVFLYCACSCLHLHDPLKAPPPPPPQVCHGGCLRHCVHAILCDMRAEQTPESTANQHLAKDSLLGPVSTVTPSQSTFGAFSLLGERQRAGCVPGIFLGHF